MKKAFDVIGGMETLKGFADDVIRVRSEIQQFEISFASLLQSKEKADILVFQMIAVAAQSPFELKTLWCQRICFLYTNYTNRHIILRCLR